MTRKRQQNELLADTAISYFADMLVAHEKHSKDIFLQLEMELFKQGYEIHFETNTHCLKLERRKGYK